jgi:hypothetical protein
MRSIQPAITELERVWDDFVPELVRATGSAVEIPRPVIVIQTKGRRNMKGWFCGGKWQSEKDKVSEITVSAEHLKGPPEDIAEVMLHEMCHAGNHAVGVSDCSVNQYHNRHFRELGEAMGLVVSRNGNKGWAKTALGPVLVKRVKKLNLDPNAFTLFRLEEDHLKQPTKMKKCRCACTVIRAAVEVCATCDRCGRSFARQD